MFAPFCSSCQRHVLLGPRRIVRFAADRADARPEVTLRCFCGALVPWDAAPPGDAVAVPAEVRAPATSGTGATC